MFTGIPVARAITFMEDFLKEKNIQQETIQEFKDLLHHCVDKDLCVFGGTVYRFPDGLPMRGPLSILVADVFLNRLETEIVETNSRV